VEVPPAILARATPDVAATVAWLESEGWTLTEARGPEGMGNALLRFHGPDGESVVIVSDRSQWMLDVALADWERDWGVELALALVSGEVEQLRAPPGGSLPRQLPAGVSWREALPSLLVRLPLEADAETRMGALGRLRADHLFGPLRRAWRSPSEGPLGGAGEVPP
jgi:hypothetical protein